MNLALWIAAGVLAAVAFAGGIIKTFIPKQKLAKQPGGRWVEDFSVVFIKTIGVLEILAAVGLILPAVVGIAPILVPVAAVCWILVMIGAIITHLRLIESQASGSEPHLSRVGSIHSVGPLWT